MEKQKKSAGNFLITLRAIKDYAGIHAQTCTNENSEQVTFNIRSLKFAVTVVEVDSAITPAVGVTPTLCLWAKANDFALSEDAIPLLCAIGTNGVGVVVELASQTEWYHPEAEVNLDNIIVNQDGKVHIVARNEGGRKDD